MTDAPKLSPNERKRLKSFIRHAERWKSLLQVDPSWSFQLEVHGEDDGKAGFLDIGSSEYYEGRLGVSKGVLGIDGNDEAEAALSFIACHEMLHALTADYHRAAISATDGNEPMMRELDYRYEQLVTKLTDVLAGLDSQARQRSARKRKGNGKA